MLKAKSPLFLLCAIFLLNCNFISDSSHADNPTTWVYNFSIDDQGWVAGFCDYPAGDEDFYELQSGIAQLPPEIEIQEKGFFISGINHSDDLFMYITKRVTGLEANHRYHLRITVDFASNAPSDCLGVGGAPGEHVTLKAGASATVPSNVLDDNGFYRLNLDKGNQSQGGFEVFALGHIGNTQPCPSEMYETKTLTGEQEAVSDEKGELSLIVGTDSGFEGRTSLYYLQIKIDVTK